MKTIRIICQYPVLLICVAACGVMVLCLGAAAFVARVADLFRVGWMKCRKLASIALLAMSVSVASAGSVSLAWDASQSPGITNYVLYAGTNNPATNATHLVKVNAGTNLTVRVEGLTPPTTWFFWATAQKGGLESDRSNVVQAQVPFPPANSRVLVVQAGVNLTNGFTDVGFFRIYFPANVP